MINDVKFMKEKLFPNWTFIIRKTVSQKKKKKEEEENLSLKYMPMIFHTCKNAINMSFSGSLTVI